jgi:hypothetical protein
VAQTATKDLKLMKIGVVLGAIAGGILVWLVTPIHFTLASMQSVGSGVIELIAGVVMGAICGGFIGALAKIRHTWHVDSFDVDGDVSHDSDCDDSRELPHEE